MSNRLSGETSPYLLQHAHNPVDWFPWGREAFERARREDRPVFLSIGYSACHWCHVMERESFEDETIARALNESFVSVKVDREERPDVDDVYMTAVQMMTGRGGWPLSAFLFPDGRPFFGGTYFPPDDRGGRTGFGTLLQRISEAWRERRADLTESALRLAEEMRAGDRVAERQPKRPLSEGSLEVLTDALKRGFDARHGGFGGTPKFPPHLALEWLLSRGEAGDAGAERIAVFTLDAMALGGLHDHLGGGFHRYSTDEEWLVPHFEKMLTDNAQLLGLYARAFGRTGRPFFARVARATADYLLAEMRGEEGGFFAATDADSEGEEGKYFVWSAAQIREALGEDAAFFSERYGVKEAGNFLEEATGRPTGLNILHLKEEPASDEEARLAPLRRRLLSRRMRRVPPGLDDKRLAGWNALAVSGLAVAGKALGEARYLQAARAAALFLLETMRDPEGRLFRTWKDGQGKIPAFLEDEAYLANALLDLSEAEKGEAVAAWTSKAREAVNGIRRRFRAEGSPGFTFTGEGHEELLVKGRDLFDKATPSASGSAVRALVRLALVESDRELAGEARAALEEVSGLMARSPHGTETWYLALDALLEFERRHGAAAEDGGPVSVSAAATAPSASRGGSFEIVVTLGIGKGFHLPGKDGLEIEAWGGRDLPLRNLELPPKATLELEDGSEEEAWEGTVSARLSFGVAAGAAKGRHVVAVNIRTRACGAGVCLPEAMASLAVSVGVA